MNTLLVSDMPRVLRRLVCSLMFLLAMNGCSRENKSEQYMKAVITEFALTVQEDTRLVSEAEELKKRFEILQTQHGDRSTAEKEVASKQAFVAFLPEVLPLIGRFKNTIERSKSGIASIPAEGVALEVTTWARTEPRVLVVLLTKTEKLIKDMMMADDAQFKELSKSLKELEKEYLGVAERIETLAIKHSLGTPVAWLHEKLKDRR